MVLSELIDQGEVNLLRPLGAVVWGEELGEPGQHYLIVIKVLNEDFTRLCSICQIYSALELIPTEHFPILWFRLFIDLDGQSPYVYEYHFDILSEEDYSRLAGLSREDRFTFVFGTPGCTRTSHFHFPNPEDIKARAKTEIEACGNALSKYANLDKEKFSQGLQEIEKSRKITGETLDEDLVVSQSTKRALIRPLPKNVEIEFR